MFPNVQYLAQAQHHGRPRRAMPAHRVSRARLGLETVYLIWVLFFYLGVATLLFLSQFVDHTIQPIQPTNENVLANYR